MRFVRVGYAYLIWSCLISIMVPTAGEALAQQVKAEPQPDALIVKVMESSGLTAQLELLPEAVFSALPGDVLPDRQRTEELRRLFRSRDSKTAMLSRVTGSLKANYDRDLLVRIQAFYETSLGKRVSKLQAAAMNSEALKETREAHKLVTSMEPSRLQIIKRIVAAEQAVALNSVLLRQFTRGLIHGSEAPTTAKVDSTNEPSRRIEDMLRALESGSETTALVACANTLRPVKDSELEELAVFLESPAAEWFRHTVAKGLQQAVYEVAVVLAQAVDRLSEPKNSSRSR
jgi:hypothetical protein